MNVLREATIFALVGFAAANVILFFAVPEVHWYVVIAGIYIGIRYGMLIGLIVWVLYRMIRFAVFGSDQEKAK